MFLCNTVPDRTRIGRNVYVMVIADCRSFQHQTITENSLGSIIQSRSRCFIARKCPNIRKEMHNT